jgi:hypothetical protein
MDRYYDLLLNDKTDYYKEVAVIVSHYINFASNVAFEAVDGITYPNWKKDVLAKLESMSKTKAAAVVENRDIWWPNKKNIWYKRAPG